MSKVDAIVDIREPPELVEAVETHEDVESVTLDKLETGDIIIRNIGFERKTPSDYASSLTGKSDRTLANQIEKMKQGFDHSYILVEGDYIDMERLPHTKINPKSLYGSTASTEARHGIPVKFCSNMELLVDRAVRLARKHNEEPVSSNINLNSVVGNSEPFAMRVYGCIDGIGESTAELLHEHYPSVESIFEASKGDLLDIDKIGESRAETIIESFRKEE